MIIFSSQISSLLDEYNTQLSQLSQLDYPANFQLLCKDIIYNPILSIYNSDPSSFSSRNFENINLDRYLYDKDTYTTTLADKLLSNSIPDLLLTKNEFPYVIPNINYESEIIWNPENKCLNFKILLENINLTNKDYILWKNIPTYKSNNYIEHYHLITRKSIRKLTLEKILILQRHGPREPLFIPPKFISTYWNKIHLVIEKAINEANLTKLGKLYCKYIGQLLKDNYSNDFDFANLDKTNILVGSSNFQRTIGTSILTLDGLGLGLSNFDLNLDIEILNFLSSDAIFTPEQKKIYNDRMENNNITIDINLTEFNQKIFDLTGFKIKKFRDYFELSSTIKCYTFHNYQILSNPEDNAELLSMVDILNNLSIYYYNTVNIMNDEFFKENKLIGKTTVDNMIKLFTDSKYKFILFTSHDNLLMPTVKYLVYGVLNNLITFDNMSLDKKYFTKDILYKINLLDFPEFNSNIRFELWTDELANKKIRFYYCSLMLFEFETLL